MLKFMTDVHNTEAISVCITPNAQDLIWDWFDVDIPPHSRNVQSFDAVLMPSLCQNTPTPQSVLVQVCHRLHHSPYPKGLSS